MKPTITTLLLIALTAAPAAADHFSHRKPVVVPSSPQGTGGHWGGTTTPRGRNPYTHPSGRMWRGGPSIGQSHAEMYRSLTIAPYNHAAANALYLRQLANAQRTNRDARIRMKHAHRVRAREMAEARKLQAELMKSKRDWERAVKRGDFK